MNEFVRHLLATIGYRFGRSVNEAKESFADLSIGNDVRTPLQIVNHLNNLMEYGLSILRNTPREKALALSFSEEVKGFHVRLREMDRLMQNATVDDAIAKSLIQGPLSDALTHIGQLMTLRRMDNDPVQGISFVKAPIKTGTTEYPAA